MSFTPNSSAITLHQKLPVIDGPLWIAKAELQSLIEALRAAGYTVVAPTLDQNAIVYGEIESSDQLPTGWRDDQQPGRYQVRQTSSDAYFEFNVGPHSWKQFLYPPRLTIQTAQRDRARWRFDSPRTPAPKYALLGVRACELAAIAIQDRVFLHGPYVDPDYQQRRHQALIVAVNCTVAAATCFCTSMDTGPECRSDFDLALTEIDGGFVVEIGSAKGAAVLEQLESKPASPDSIDAAASARQRAVDQISKRMDTTDIHELLLSNLDHQHWDEVAGRCLACTNCTMVCPTCFCATVSEVSDLAGDNIERKREWDSCFNLSFSYTAGGTVRGDIRSRYRQWLTHKLASWQDQFDTSGCVGCGRCITWCPVGIDLTEEVAAIRGQPSRKRSLPVLGQKPDVCVVPAATAKSDPERE